MKWYRTICYKLRHIICIVCLKLRKVRSVSQSPNVYKSTFSLYQYKSIVYTSNPLYVYTSTYVSVFYFRGYSHLDGVILYYIFFSLNVTSMFSFFFFFGNIFYKCKFRKKFTTETWEMIKQSYYEKFVTFCSAVHFKEIRMQQINWYFRPLKKKKKLNSEYTECIICGILQNFGIQFIRFF